MTLYPAQQTKHIKQVLILLLTEKNDENNKVCVTSSACVNTINKF